MARTAEGRLPTFVIIGAMKGGTTTLHAVLRTHPEIFMSREKELDFFAEARNLRRGEAWYRRQFRTDRPIRGESSPIYAAWPAHDGVPERMHDLLPDARIVYCVRDPVERAMSHYRHALAAGSKHALGADGDAPSIDEAILREPFLRQGRYGTQLRRYLAAGFPLERIHVVQSERLRSHRDAVVGDVLRFVGADPDGRFAGPREDWHASHRKRVPTPRGRRVKAAVAPVVKRLPWRVRGPAERLMLWPLSTPMPRTAIRPDTRERLREALAAEAEDLRALTGQPFDGWQV